MSKILAKYPNYFRNILIALISWSAVVMLSFYFNVREEEQRKIILAQNEAANLVNYEEHLFHDMVTHRWKNYKILPEHFTSDTLKNLTVDSLIFSLLFDFIQTNKKHFNVRFISTSPINMKNLPKADEKDLLQKIDFGSKDIKDYFTQNGKSFLKYIRPIHFVNECRACHAGNSSKDFKSAVIAEVNIDKFENSGAYQAILYTHGGAYLAGLFLIFTMFFLSIKESNKKLAFQRELMISEEKFRTLANNLPGVIYMYDEHPDGKREVQYFGPQTADIFGHELAGIIKNDFNLFFEYIHPDDKRKLFEEAEKILNHGDILDFEYRVEISKKNYVWLRSIGKVVMLDGGIQRWQGMLVNINARKFAQQQLSQSEKLFRLLAENAKDVIYLQSIPDGICIYISPSVKDLTGYSSDECYQNDNLFSDSIHPDWEEYYRHSHNNLMKGIVAPYYEYQLITKSGEIKWCYQRNSLECDETGNPIMLEGIISDITEKKEIETALKESEEKFRAITENSSDITMIIDSSFHITYASSSVRQFGFTPSELFGINPLEVIHEEDHELVRQKRIESEKNPGNIVKINIVRIRIKDGSTLFLESNLNCLYHLESINGIVINGRNITGRITFEKKLKESEERFRHLFFNAPIGIMRTAVNGRIILGNPYVVSMLGYATFQGLENINITDHIYKFSEERDRLKDILNTKGFALGFESVWLKKDGSEIIVKQDAKVVYHDDGSINFFEGIVEDITERRKAEEKIRQFNRELEQRVNERTKQLVFAKNEITKALKNEKKVNKLKTGIISRMSHEYRTPLTVIQSSTYLLKHSFKSGDSNRFEEHIHRIQNSVRNMTQLLEDVLDVGRDKTRELYHPVEFDIIGLCRELQAKFIEADNYSHAIDFSPDAQKVIIFDDDKIINKILSNILSNAQKFSYEQSTIKIIFEQSRENYKISISDSGLGIPPEEKEYIFEPFFRCTNLDDSVPGVGLGLTISKQFAELIGAKIEVTSELNEGSAFVLLLAKKNKPKKRAPD